MNIGAAIGKPFSNIKNMVIGIILLIIPIANILTIPGYLLRIANRTMNGDHSLPGFENFSELIVNSIKAIVVGLAYGIIAAIVAFILMLIPFVGPALALIWYIVFMFIALSAFMALAKTGDLGAAFGFGEVFNKAKSGDFIVAVIVGAVIAFLIALIVGAIVAILFAAPLLPVVLGGATDPAAIASIMSTLMGVGLIAFIVLLVVEYVLAVFFYSLVAEAYQK